MLSADTNIFLYAANPRSPKHTKASAFFEGVAEARTEFATCELVLLEVYMQLRNPAVMPKPLSAPEAVAFCRQLRENPSWQHVDYDPIVSDRLWSWAQSTKSGFRRIIDARLALTLLQAGITDFATANVDDFQEFGFRRVFSPV